jgi:hypothetical protein
VTVALCFVILDHRHDRYFAELVDCLRLFCPEADVVWYDSGASPAAAGSVRCKMAVPRLPCSRPLRYAKVAPFFLDMFEWAARRGYDYVVNVETDMAFIRPGFGDFLSRVMQGVDYLAPGFRRATPTSSRWRPYRSLRKELPELLSILGIDHTNRGFSPGQVFSARYIATLLSDPIVTRVRAFVERNQGQGGPFSLQEVLLPTLADVLGLTPRDYPTHLATFNRYRPYHGKDAVGRALAVPDAYFLHPIRREERDPARSAVRALVARTASSRAREAASDSANFLV